MSVGSALSKLGSTASAALSTKAGKLAATGAAIGGGSYAALTGLGAGASNLMEQTGIGGVVDYVSGNGTATGTTGKGLSTLITVGIIVGIIVLIVKVVLPAVGGGRRS